MKSATILVTGDYVLDHHIYEGKRQHFCDSRHRGVRVVEELGGAALVHYLLAELKRGVTSHLSVAVDQKRQPELDPDKTVPPELAAFAIWRPFGIGRDASPEKAMWRTEDAMGFGCLDEKPLTFDWPGNPELPPRPDVVVLSDGGMGFREDEKQWPDDAALARARWIVLKASHPFAQGKLWEHVTRPERRSKLVVIVSSSELRKGPARISSGLSWDATVESVLAALAPGGPYEALTGCRHLVVAFGTEGDLWLEMGRTFAAAQAHLVYDAASVEGEHRKPETRGTAFGALSCLTASVAWRLALTLPGELPDLETALEGGLSAIYDLFNRGHGRAAAPGEGFPAKRLSKAISEATCRYARTVFPATAPSAGPSCGEKVHAASGGVCWSLLHEALRQQGPGCPEPAWDLAERVAIHGPIALGSLPHLSIGNLMSADRREIESLRVLRRLILDYKNRKPSECKKPLSIGVFGPPGAGKSFAVKEIAQALMGEKEWREGWMEFNLSQFKSGTDDLIGAFHQIRDRVLKAVTPVAFFDEFDSRNYAWLQYLLAPMQDGAFQEGQITHPIGKCIFIFAGATSWTFESFGPPQTNSGEYHGFRMAKGPDFKSRLDGFLDVLGPNQRHLVEVATDGQGYDTDTPDQCDIFHPMRRAFVMRAELRCKREESLEIDAGLLRALLRAKEYKHGARSLSKLIEPLREGRPGAICPSLLPPRQQIDLHVDAADFLRDCGGAIARLAGSPLPDPLPVAKAIHETYRELGRTEGWLENANDIGYDALHEFYKQSNLAAAKRMPVALALIGLALERGKASGSQERIRLRLEYNLELLAEAEHAGWMDWHLDQGWQYGPAKPPTKLAEEPDPKKKFHPCLKPYLELSDDERNKDRNAIRHYIEFAEKAGMKIVDRSAASGARAGGRRSGKKTKSGRRP